MRMAPSAKLKRTLLFSTGNEFLRYVAAPSGTNLYIKMKNPMEITILTTISQLLISGGFSGFC